jgi:hypothetical protein
MRRRTFNPVETRTTADIDSAFRAATKEADQAVILLPAPFMGRNASQLAELALANRLPTFNPLPPHALLDRIKARNAKPAKSNLQISEAREAFNAFAERR